MWKIAVDVMGADHGAMPIVQGAIAAAKARECKVLLVGDEKEIVPVLAQSGVAYGENERVEVVHCSDYIRMEESATDALKRKDSSIYIATDLVRDGKADALVSPGHSGSTMSLATLRLGRIDGVSRPAICTLMPTITDKPSMILDAGANTDCKPEYLVEFAIMGYEYARSVMGYEKDSIRVGLLANGEEESKGNELTKATFALLKGYPFFKGNVEGNDIFNGSVDVIVCDGFSGNLVLKASEGVSSSISQILKQEIKSSPLRMLGGLLLKGAFANLKKKVDYAEYGGAPLLGVKQVAIISHGKSNARAIENAVYQALRACEAKVCERIAQAFASTKG
ncbi:phosphate acyltransferase PlsX [Helicobacter canis]|uniref:Phosphate acyltransferase n=1 Tax=Helicobacter canis NCTC 12740 TaxID=1357399 RepID=V8CIK4_9HELI|nr:phosphate acyltransferase PlsX [Helicobacter canis]ETD26561.1 fatty acid/phospholipid synthesis protein PlsX [Helicobacter canis NCTC 12740]